MHRAWALGLLVLVAGCSPARMGMNRMADALSATASAYARDDDPEFVRTGAPATLKMVEMMLEGHPAHPGLLRTACSGFAQYAYAFLQVDSEIHARADDARAREAAERAGRMYGRARGYCLRALRLTQPALAGALEREPREAPGLLQAAARPEVPVLYWTAVAWAGELSVAGNQLSRLGELPVLKALLTRALELDEAWGHGAIHEAMIAVEGLPPLLGGSPVRARRHFERAVALSDGRSAFAYVTYAASVALPARNRREFDEMLDRALAVDPVRTPELRLANLIAQKRARHLRHEARALFR